ncbi:MAG: hypothetical protein JSS63_14640 [Bacteroidetes bacterium]|nr:hypothetical protein [Bacteroidota bacterium]
MKRGKKDKLKRKLKVKLEKYVQIEVEKKVSEFIAANNSVQTKDVITWIFTAIGLIIAIINGR